MPSVKLGFILFGKSVCYPIAVWFGMPAWFGKRQRARDLASPKFAVSGSPEPPVHCHEGISPLKPLFALAFYEDLQHGFQGDISLLANGPHRFRIRSSLR